MEKSFAIAQKAYNTENKNEQIMYKIYMLKSIKYH